MEGKVAGNVARKDEGGGREEEEEGGREGRGRDKLGALASYLTSYPSLPSLTMA